MKPAAAATLLLTLPARAQSPAVTSDAEILAMAQSDQADRAASPKDPADVVSQNRRDAARLARAKELVAEDAFKDPHSFARAGLILQHGRTPDDFLVSRELALLACFHKATYDSLPALAEDRFLVAIHRPQRFGGNHSSMGSDSLLPIEDHGDNAVTDRLREDCFMPSLALSRKDSPADAAKAGMPAAMERLRARMNPQAKGPDWITNPAASGAAAELAGLEAKPASAAIRKVVLGLYAADRLFIPADYRRAAALLLRNAANPEDLLLANELAAVAIMRLDAPAWRIYAESWDRFAAAIEQPTRYGTLPGTKRAGSIPPALLRDLQVP